MNVSRRRLFGLLPLLPVAATPAKSPGTLDIFNSVGAEIDVWEERTPEGAHRWIVYIEPSKVDPSASKMATVWRPEVILKRGIVNH